MPRRIVHTERAPAAIGPYSQAVQVGPLLFVSGQIALDPRTGALVPGDAAAQMRQVLRNVGAVLDAAGASFRDVARTTLYLVDLAGDFTAVSQVYGEVFDHEPPARATVGVLALPRGALVEMDCIAHLEA